MGVDQLKELNRLQQENERLRRAVSDLTLDKLILTEAARGNFGAPLAAEPVSIMSGVSWAFPSVGLATCCASIAPRSVSYREVGLMKIAWLPT